MQIAERCTTINGVTFGCRKNWNPLISLVKCAVSLPVLPYVNCMFKQPIHQSHAAVFCESRLPSNVVTQSAGQTIPLLPFKGHVVVTPVVDGDDVDDDRVERQWNAVYMETVSPAKGAFVLSIVLWKSDLCGRQGSSFFVGLLPQGICDWGWGRTEPQIRRVSTLTALGWQRAEEVDLSIFWFIP